MFKLFGRRKKPSEDRKYDCSPVLSVGDSADKRRRDELYRYKGVACGIPFEVSCRDMAGGDYEYRIYAYTATRLIFASVVNVPSLQLAGDLCLCLARAVHRYSPKQVDAGSAFWFWSTCLASCYRVMLRRER